MALSVTWYDAMILPVLEVELTSRGHLSSVASCPNMAALDPSALFMEGQMAPAREASIDHEAH
jgi:hypothetical protein